MAQYGLLSLPIELLRQIADCIIDPKLWEDGFLNWGYHVDTRKRRDNQHRICQRTICNLRLTNKRLCDAASHALMPILRIHLNEKSLIGAQKIANSPQIAAGIGGVQLVLAYCPENLVNDLRVFAIFRMGTFNKLDDEYTWYRNDVDVGLKDDLEQESNDLNDDNEDADMPRTERTEEEWREEQKRNGKVYALASDMWQKMRIAWDEESSNTEESIPNQHQQDQHYRKLLRKGWSRFQALHEEQHSLITTGAFATQVADILSKLPSVQSMCLKDDTGDIQTDDYSLQLARAIVSDENVVSILSEPMPWSSAVEMWNEDEAEFQDVFAQVKAAAALLWDLPIACSRARVSLRGLAIQCFPADRAYQLGTVEDGYLNGTDDEFARAVSQLISFQFTPSMEAVSGMGGMLELLSACQEAQIANYIQQCSKNKYLRNLQLKLDLFQDLDETPSIDRSQHFNLGNALHGIETTQLHKLCVEYVSMSHDAMKELCLALGVQTRRLRLEGVFLHGGSWADILDLLRLQIGSRVLHDQCSLFLYTLDSLEVYDYYRAQRRLLDVSTYAVTRILLEENTPDLMMAYVEGQFERNPLFKYHAIQQNHHVHH